MNMDLSDEILSPRIAKKEHARIQDKLLWFDVRKMQIFLKKRENGLLLIFNFAHQAGCFDIKII